MELSSLYLKKLFFSKKNFLYFTRELAKPKTFLYFGKWNFLAPNLKNLLYISKKIIYLVFFIEIFFIRVFFIRIVFVRIIRRNFYVVKNKLRRLFTSTAYLHSSKNA